MDLEGTRLGQYELREEIGSGALAVVYDARDLAADRRVHVHVARRTSPRESQSLRRFQDTVQAVSKLNHPGIATIYDTGTDGDRFYVVMEPLDGEPLDQYLKNSGPLSPKTALAFLGQATDALDYAHARGLYHGNLAAGNLFVTTQGLKLNGLELTSARPATQDAIEPAPQTSPGPAHGRSVSSWDLYNVAMIGFEMLAGQPPFDPAPTFTHPDNVPSLQSPPSIIDFRPSLPRAVDTVFGRALAPQSERRFWSGRTFVTALAEALNDDPAADTGTGTPVPYGRRRSAFPWRWFALGALIVFLLVAGGFTIARLTGPGNPDSDAPFIGLQLGTVPPTQLKHTSTPLIVTDPARIEPTVPPPPTKATSSESGRDNLATVKVPVANVRALPTLESELVTQVLMGETVQILGQEGDWYEIAAVEQPSPKNIQGYPGWIRAEAISSTVAPDTALTAIVTALSAQVRATPEESAPVLYDLSLDSRLAVQSADESWVEVFLPDGATGWLARERVHLICTKQDCPGDGSETPDPPRSLDDVLNTSMQFVGTPYLWGGASSDAFDCSGFVYRVFHANGITVPRDSSPMSESGDWVEKDQLRPGDVVFLAENAGTGRVTHCSLYIGDGKMVTSVGTSPISIVPLDHPRYLQEYWGARRFPK